MNTIIIETTDAANIAHQADNYHEILNDKHSLGLLLFQQGETMANDIGAVAFIECSAKNMDNVDEVFVLATQLAMSAGSKDSKSSVLFTNCSNCAIL